MPKLQPLDINNLINLLPHPPKPQPEKKKPGRKPKPQEEITDNMTYKEKRKIYMRNYMRQLTQNRLKK
jgi:hypothetical protein